MDGKKVVGYVSLFGICVVFPAVIATYMKMWRDPLVLLSGIIENPYLLVLLVGFVALLAFGLTYRPSPAKPDEQPESSTEHPS